MLYQRSLEINYLASYNGRGNAYVRYREYLLPDLIPF